MLEAVAARFFSCWGPWGQAGLGGKWDPGWRQRPTPGFAQTSPWAGPQQACLSAAPLLGLSHLASGLSQSLGGTVGRQFSLCEPVFPYVNRQNSTSLHRLFVRIKWDNACQLSSMEPASWEQLIAVFVILFSSFQISSFHYGFSYSKLLVLLFSYCLFLPLGIRFNGGCLLEGQRLNSCHFSAWWVAVIFASKETGSRGGTLGCHPVQLFSELLCPRVTWGDAGPDSAGLRWGLRFRIPHELPGDALPAGPGTTLWLARL